MIRANCRNKFTAKDFEFIVDTLAKDSKNKTALSGLLTDEEIRDKVLDDDLLFQSVNQNTGFNKISPYFYFYILTRRVFTELNLDDRNLTDYVACMLAEFCSLRRTMTFSKNHNKKYQYFTDLMLDFIDSSSHEAFLIRSHMGNYALFLTGFFPDYIFRKSTYGRKTPGFDYYEKMGSSSYHWASQHSMAVKYNLEEILANLAQRFRLVRIALNNMTDKYLTMDERPEKMDKMLRQVFYGKTGNKNFDT